MLSKKRVLRTRSILSSLWSGRNCTGSLLMRFLKILMAGMAIKSVKRVRLTMPMRVMFY